MWLTPRVSIAVKEWDQSCAGTPSTSRTSTLQLGWPRPSAPATSTTRRRSLRSQVRQGSALDDEPPCSDREPWPANRCGLASQAERSPEVRTAGSPSQSGSPRPNIARPSCRVVRPMHPAFEASRGPASDPLGERKAWEQAPFERPKEPSRIFFNYFSGNTPPRGSIEGEGSMRSTVPRNKPVTVNEEKEREEGSPMASNTPKKNRTDQLASEQRLADGLNKDAQTITSIVIGGTAALG